MKRLIKQPYICGSTIKPNRHLKLKNDTDCYKCKHFVTTEENISNSYDLKLKCEKLPYFILNDHIFFLNYLGCKSFEVIK